MARRRKQSAIIFVVIVALVWLARSYLRKPTQQPQRIHVPAGPWHIVVRVWDGDTVDLDNGVRVRLRGVDAPESRYSRRKGIEPCGAESKEILKLMVLRRQVRLEQDWETHDNFDPPRMLAYLFLEDGTDVNGELIRRGYAHAYRKYNYREKQKYIDYEIEAHTKGVGCLPIRAPNMKRE
jgi:micrococcal nuclease